MRFELSCDVSERVRGAARVPVRVSDSESPGSQLVKYGKKAVSAYLPPTHTERVVPLFIFMLLTQISSMYKIEKLISVREKNANKRR